MRKALCLYLPNLLVDLSRRRLRLHATGSAAPTRGSSSSADSVLILIVETVGTKQTVVACCPRCRRAGVAHGMTLAHAQALLPVRNVQIDPYSPDRETKALRSLAVWLARLVPVVALDPPGALLMDIGGCERLFGSDQRHAQRIGRAVWRLGLRCRIAVAPTFAAASALARFAPQPFGMTTAPCLPEALAPLPVAALRIDNHAIAALHEVGVHTVGEILRLPRVSLASRFGPELALRLDQAFGRAIETIDPIRPAPPLSVERTFDGGTTRLETLHLAFTDLLQELAEVLETRGAGVRRLLAQCTRVGSSPVSFTITLSRPSRNVKHLRNLLARRLDTVNMGFGVEAASLTAVRTGRLKALQRAAWDTGPSDAGPAELIDTLADRLGSHAVAWLEPVSTHIPEKTFRARPAIEASPALSTTMTVQTLRPSLLLTPPEPAAVIALTPDGPPVHLQWRGRTHPIIAAAGPERIAPEWWLGNSGARDYYRVQTDAGLWLWIFRGHETSRWHVHGIWA